MNAPRTLPQSLRPILMVILRNSNKIQLFVVRERERERERERKGTRRKCDENTYGKNDKIIYGLEGSLAVLSVLLLKICRKEDKALENLGSK